MGRMLLLAATVSLVAGTGVFAHHSYSATYDTSKTITLEGKLVQFMAPTVCMCSTMQRIDPQHLAWTLENLAEGNVVNQIKVPAHEAASAKVALDRMLAIS